MNSFGSTGQQFALYDPRGVRDSRQRFRRNAVPTLDRANSFYCPTGRWPSRGWLLVARGDYDQLDPYSTTLSLCIGDTTAPGNVAPLNNLSIVQAQCVTRGLAGDPSALYLVEVTDGRGVLFNEWFQFPTTSIYNIRSPAYPQTFHPASMNSGGPVTTTWTWSTMLQDLWDQMGTHLGAWPGLPYAPAGTPEGFWFPGVPAWTALCDVLDHLGMTVACDLTKASPFTIVDAGATDDAFTALQARYLTNLEDDLEWIDAGSARVPKTLTVLFRRRNSVYGTEETVTYRNDGMAQQWNMSSFYSVTVNAPETFASAVGSHFIWSDFTVCYDVDSNPLPADTATANAIAQERTTQYFSRIYRQTAGSMTQTYAGTLPFATGSQVDGVGWVMEHERGYYGWRTEIVRGRCPPWPKLWD